MQCIYVLEFSPTQLFCKKRNYNLLFSLSNNRIDKFIYVNSINILLFLTITLPKFDINNTYFMGITKTSLLYEPFSMSWTLMLTSSN